MSRPPSASYYSAEPSYSRVEPRSRPRPQSRAEFRDRSPPREYYPPPRDRGYERKERGPSGYYTTTTDQAYSPRGPAGGRAYDPYGDRYGGRDPYAREREPYPRDYPRDRPPPQRYDDYYDYPPPRRGYDFPPQEAPRSYFPSGERLSFTGRPRFGGRGGRGGRGGSKPPSKRPKPQQQKRTSENTRQYKNHLRMYFSIRVAMRFIQHMLGEKGKAYGEELKAWEKTMMTDMKALDPMSNEIQVKFVTKEDSDEWFKLAEEYLKEAIELVKNHPKYNETEEVTTTLNVLTEKFSDLETRHAGVIMARFLAFALAAIGTEGATRQDQYVQVIKDLDISLDSDPTLLEELEEHKAKKIANWKEHLSDQANADPNTRVNCKPGTGSMHKSTGCKD